MITELWNPRKQISPSELLANLSEECKKLEVDKCDVYGDFALSPEQSYLRKFEEEISNTFYKEDALFLPSGVMAQQIALHIHYQNAINIKGIENVDRSFICHYSSHLLLHENDTCSHLLNMKPLIIQADSNNKLQQPISYTNILNKLQEYNYKVFCIIIECPHREIGGKCTSFQELQQISQLCRSHHIALHMDGARLWEALAYYTTTINPLTNENVTISDLCNLFDSIYVSCYKGIGGITGAVLLGDADFMIQARIWLRRYGGNVYTLLPYAVSSYTAYRNYVSWNLTNTTSNSESSGSSSTSSADVNTHKIITTSSMKSAENNISVSNNTLLIPYSMKSRLIRLKEIIAVLSNNTLLQDYIYFDPPIPHVCLIHVYIKSTIEKARIAHSKSRSSSGIGCFPVLRQRELYPEECYFEFNLGMVNGVIPNEIWVEGWTAFVKALLE